MSVGALVVTHGDLGRVLVEETLRLMGHRDQFESLKTEGMSPDDVTGEIKKVIGEDPWIVFTDTPGTTPTVRAHLAISEGQAVVTGVNIGMLLSFLAHRERLSAKELAERMVEDGRRSLGVKWPK